MTALPASCTCAAPDAERRTLIHATAAAMSWIVATRLVARWIAPICVRSPNLRIVAMMFTTTAAYSSRTLWCSGLPMSPDATASPSVTHAAA